jgi:hypothetical protein
MATKRTRKQAPKKTAKVTVRKAKTKAKAKVARRAETRSSRTRQGRIETLQAMQRLDPLTKAYQTSGLAPEEARQRALDELGLKDSSD